MNGIMDLVHFGEEFLYALAGLKDILLFEIPLGQITDFFVKAHSAFLPAGFLVNLFGIAYIPESLTVVGLFIGGGIGFVFVFKIVKFFTDLVL